jgi:translation initiation factor 1
MSKKQQKIKGNIIYSTDDNFQFDFEEEQQQQTLPREKQQLKIHIDRKNRSGKEITVIGNFVGSIEDLEVLAKFLKTRCGTGGSVKEGEILIQGDLREKIVQILIKEGYNAKKTG